MNPPSRHKKTTAVIAVALAVPAIALAVAWLRTPETSVVVVQPAQVDLSLHDAIARQSANDLQADAKGSAEAAAEILSRVDGYLPGEARSESARRLLLADLDAVATLRRLAISNAHGLAGAAQSLLKNGEAALSRLDDRAYRILASDVAGRPLDGVDEHVLAALVRNLALSGNRYEPSTLQLMVTRYKRIDRSRETGNTLASALLSSIWIRTAVVMPNAEQPDQGIRGRLVEAGSTLGTESELVGFLTGDTSESVGHAARVTGLVQPDGLFEVVRAQIVRMRDDQAVIPLLDALSRYGMRARPTRGQISTLYQISENATTEAKLRETLEKLSGRSV